jgi:hypothetical protein
MVNVCARESNSTDGACVWLAASCEDVDEASYHGSISVHWSYIGVLRCENPTYRLCVPQGGGLELVSLVPPSKLLPAADGGERFTAHGYGAVLGPASEVLRKASGKLSCVLEPCLSEAQLHAVSETCLQPSSKVCELRLSK